MSLAELDEAKAAIRKLRLPIQNIRTRRFQPALRRRPGRYARHPAAKPASGRRASICAINGPAAAIRRWCCCAIYPAP